MISWEHLPDPDASLPTAESGLQELFEEIRATVGQEVQIVQAVFPNPPYVMQVFLQRVFAQSVSFPFAFASQANVDYVVSDTAAIGDIT